MRKTKEHTPFDELPSFPIPKKEIDPHKIFLLWSCIPNFQLWSYEWEGFYTSYWCFKNALMSINFKSNKDSRIRNYYEDKGWTYEKEHFRIDLIGSEQQLKAFDAHFHALLGTYNSMEQLQSYDKQYKLVYKLSHIRHLDNFDYDYDNKHYCVSPDKGHYDDTGNWEEPPGKKYEFFYPLFPDMVDINHLGIMFSISNPNHKIRVLFCAPNFPEIECCQCLKYLDEYSKKYPDRLKDILYKIKGPGFFYVYGVLCCNERGWIDMFNFIPHEYFYTLPELQGGIFNNFPWTDEGLIKVRDKLIKSTMVNLEDLPNHRLIGKPDEIMDIRDPLPKKQDLGFYKPQAFHTLCENTLKILHEWSNSNMSEKEIQECVEKINSIEKELLEKKEILKQKLSPREAQILEKIEEEKQEAPDVKFEGYPDV